MEPQTRVWIKKTLPPHRSPAHLHSLSPVVCTPAFSGIFGDADEECAEDERGGGETYGQICRRVIPPEKILPVLKGVDLNGASKAQTGTHAVTE